MVRVEWLWHRLSLGFWLALYVIPIFRRLGGLPQWMRNTVMPLGIFAEEQGVFLESCQTELCQLIRLPLTAAFTRRR